MTLKVSIAGFAVLLVGILLFLGGSPNVQRPLHPLALHTPSGNIFYLEVADTARERELGLGGRESMKKDEGMLFIFPEPSEHSFWMKDMEFPLDIVWLALADDLGEYTDVSGQRLIVVHLENGIATSTYPTLFAPEAQASFVAEIVSGAAESADIQVGTILTLEQS